MSSTFKISNFQKDLLLLEVQKTRSQSTNKIFVSRRFSGSPFSKKLSSDRFEIKAMKNTLKSFFAAPKVVRVDVGAQEVEDDVVVVDVE